MIWRNQNSPVPVRQQCIQQRADDMAIDLFESFDLGISPPFMGGFIRGLDMHTDQVMVS